MRRHATLLVLLTVVMVLAGCGGSDSPSTGTQPATVTETTEPATVTETTEPATTTTATPPPPKPTPQRQTITIRVVDGKPRGGIARPKVKKGANVLLIVHSDTADEVHLHGYDISREVTADGITRIRFVARFPGRFEVELEQSGVQLAELTVR